MATFVVDGAEVEKLLRSKQGPVGRYLSVRTSIVQDAAKAQILARTPGRGKLASRVTKRWIEEGSDLGVSVGVWTLKYAAWVHDGNAPPGSYILPKKPGGVLVWMKDPAAARPRGKAAWRAASQAGLVIVARRVKASRPNRYLTDNLRRAVEL
jgi:hypothetical protein